MLYKIRLALKYPIMYVLQFLIKIINDNMVPKMQQRLSK